MARTPTFVLVHGANLGGWCWHDVEVILRANGYQVFSPTLDLRLSASLRHHINAIKKLIIDNELTDVVLVGHSYGGMVITGVADFMRERIMRLVYLDAAVPSDGDDFASHIPGLSDVEAKRRREFYRSLSLDGIWLPPPPLQLVGITDAKCVAKINSLLLPQPLATWLEPIRLVNGGAEGLPKTYVLATEPPTEDMGYPKHGEVARQSQNWTYRQIATGHAMMLTAPTDTAVLLLEAVAQE
jgi:pimeloyl-ACP methyl ester carboxylesterase